MGTTIISCLDKNAFRVANLLENAGISVSFASEDELRFRNQDRQKAFSLMKQYRVWFMEKQFQYFMV